MKKHQCCKFGASLKKNKKKSKFANGIYETRRGEIYKTALKRGRKQEQKEEKQEQKERLNIFHSFQRQVPLTFHYHAVYELILLIWFFVRDVKQEH